MSSSGPRYLPIRLFHAAYKLAVSPLLGNRCRFHPCCSDYWLGAVTTHGYLEGHRLAIGRLLRCHPWCEGGIDPVPPACAKATAGQAANKSGTSRPT